MRTLMFSIIAAAVVCTAGCNKPESPDAVAKDVAAAQQKAATEVSNSEQSAAKDLNKAADSVDDKLVNFNNTASRDAYNLTLAKADGDRRVAVANCSALGGDAQSKCMSQADANYAATKAAAKASAMSDKQ